MYNFRSLVTSVLGVSALVLSHAARAQSDVTAAVKSEDNPRMRRFSVEIRPVETLASAVPGLGSGGLTVESSLGRKWAVNVGASYVDVNNLPTKYVTTTNDRTNEPLVDSGYGYTTALGLRYYDAPIGDSVYGGMALDYSEAHFGWGYRDESFASRQIQVTPSVLAGYRWVWQNGFLARVGAGVGLPSTVRQSLSASATHSAADASAGESKVKDLMERRLMAKLDFGVGMMF